MASADDEDFAPPTITRKEVRKFREQIHALGAVWIILGALAGALTAAVFAGAVQADRAVEPRDSPLWLLVAGVSLGWFALGVCTCLKQLWAVYAGLALSYLSFVGQLINLNVCAGVIVLLVILQAHRVIGWANAMRAAGVPLTTRPEQIEAPPR